jgi:hypothetical protein
MQPAPPAALQLASRLKQLRQQWPQLTQANPAKALSDEEILAPATELFSSRCRVRFTISLARFEESGWVVGKISQPGELGQYDAPG